MVNWELKIDRMALSPSPRSPPSTAATTTSSPRARTLQRIRPDPARVLVEVECSGAGGRTGDPRSAAVFAGRDSRARCAAARFSEVDGESVKTIESRINHDVKAIEYFMRDRLAANREVMKVAEFIHFACTSEDINNLAHALMLGRARDAVMLPALDALVRKLDGMARELADAAMLAHTHGQPASPTTMGKELANVAHRLVRGRERMAGVKLTGKFNGAVGNYNAHLAAYPGVDWEKLARGRRGLGLESTPTPRKSSP